MTATVVTERYQHSICADCGEEWDTNSEGDSHTRATGHAVWLGTHRKVEIDPLTGRERRKIRRGGDGGNPLECE